MQVVPIEVPVLGDRSYAVGEGGRGSAAPWTTRKATWPGRRRSRALRGGDILTVGTR